MPASRREFLAAAAAFLAPRVALGTTRAREVVLYSSVDDYLLRDVVKAARDEAALDIRLVGDTEATKTTGLVLRLLSERANPRADVWWSSEPFGTVKLAREGVLEPYTSRAEADFAPPGADGERPGNAGVGGWPAGLRPVDRMWYGFAPRARVIVFNTKRVKPADAPRALRDLALPAWKDRVAMARPQFGTTRGQMALLAHLYGGDALRAWLTAMKSNGLKLYDGNSSVVRAVAFGERDAGLTDTDDVYAAQREAWPVDLAFEVVDEGDDEGRGAAAAPAAGAMGSAGPMSIPNTVARVKGGPNTDAAAALIDFILSERVERLLAASDSRNAPIREAVKKDFPGLALRPGPVFDFAAVEAAVERAMKTCDEVLG
ncbi:MAG: extracellular solute-binding protein [Phycisphaerales bacterium]